MFTQGFGSTGFQALGQNQPPSFVDKNDNQIPGKFPETVSVMKFAPSKQQYYKPNTAFLAVGFWDGNVVIYQITYNPQDQNPAQIQQQATINAQAPILGLCWQLNNFSLLLACADNNIKRYDLQNQMSPLTTLGSHQAPVRGVHEFTNATGYQTSPNTFIVSGGWDCRIKFWQWNSQSQQISQLADIYLAKPIHQMSLEFPLLVTCHSELVIHYWNLNKVAQNNFNPVGVTSSQLKYPTTAVCCFPDGKGWAMGSIEGRCSIRNFEPMTDKIDFSQDFCFKCHRKEDNPNTNNSMHNLFAINGIAFNKDVGSFATIGQDGNYYFWNKDTKSRLKQCPANPPCPITAADFNESGNLFAFAYGYDWGKGVEEWKLNSQRQEYEVKIFVRKVPIEEIKKNK